MPPYTLPELPYAVLITEVPAISSASVSWPMRTVIFPASCCAASSRRTTTCSSSASSNERLDQDRGGPANGVGEPALAVEVGGQIGDRDGGRRQRLALQSQPEQVAQLRHVVLVEGIAQLDDPLVDAAGVVDHDQQQQ